MSKVKPCPTCGSNDIYRSEPVSAGGGHAPNLLPGLGRWYASATLYLVICRGCGMMRMFASPDALERIGDRDEWSPV
jgi:hypothetical protein